MTNILLLGATGNLGKVLLDELLPKNYKVRVLVRNPQKLKNKHKNLEIIVGKVTDKNELERSLKNIDVVVSVLGHGFRTKYPIQKNVMEILIPLMNKNKIKRFITVTGSALIVSEDKSSKIRVFEEKVLSVLDPYRIKDARDQQELLEKSTLSWTVIRTPVHSDMKSDLKNVGYKKPNPWESVGREAVSKFVIECIKESRWIRKSPVIY